jgi:N-acetylglutamate synthase-like GNAT family acetyltransferase
MVREFPKAGWHTPGYFEFYHYGLLPREADALPTPSFPFTLVAMLDQQILGICSVIFELSFEGDARYVPLLVNVLVQEDDRDRGIGSLLVESAIQRTRELSSSFDFTKLYLQTTALAGWYTSKGWKEVQYRKDQDASPRAFCFDLFQ